MDDSKHDIEDIYRLVRDFIDNQSSPNKIPIKSKDGVTFLNPCDILYVKADWNYTEVHTGKEKMEVVSMNIGKFQELLPKSTFQRVNRSIIINTKYLSKLDKTSKKCILSTDGEEMEFVVGKGFGIIKY